MGTTNDSLGALLPSLPHFCANPTGSGNEERRSRGPWFPLVEKRDEWGSLRKILLESGGDLAGVHRVLPRSYPEVLRRRNCPKHIPILLAAASVKEFAHHSSQRRRGVMITAMVPTSADYVFSYLWN